MLPDFRFMLLTIGKAVLHSFNDTAVLPLPCRSILVICDSHQQELSAIAFY